MKSFGGHEVGGVVWWVVRCGVVWCGDCGGEVKKCVRKSDPVLDLVGDYGFVLSS
eukprot:m.184301 g.184301  ORF g.184301 m.184301 type:complete len:55 (+) comp24692_c0_seq1:3158-3322(+)